MDYNGFLANYVGMLDWRLLMAYLRANDWLKTTTKSDDYAVYTKDDESVLVPRKTDYPDYTNRVIDAIISLSLLESRDPFAILYDIQGVRSDRTMWRLQHPSIMEGGIDLSASIDFLSGTKKAMHSVACSAIDPKPVHKRLQKVQADAFIDKCRLNRSRPGSFIVYIDCPLDYDISEEEKIQSVLFDGDTPFSFARVVTVNLMHAMAEFKQAERENSIDRLVERALHGSSISANLCDALIELQTYDAESMLSVSVKWGVDDRLEPLSRGVMADIEVDDEISFTLKDRTFETVLEVADKLRPKDAPAIREYICYIDALKGKPDTDGEMQGTVEVSFVHNERMLKAKVELDKKDYQKAVDAHRKYIPVRVKGLLTYRSRIHELTELEWFDSIV